MMCVFLFHFYLPKKDLRSFVALVSVEVTAFMKFDMSVGQNRFTFPLIHGVLNLKFSFSSLNQLILSYLSMVG